MLALGRERVATEVIDPSGGAGVALGDLAGEVLLSGRM
jgi:hypothetical protein